MPTSSRATGPRPDTDLGNTLMLTAVFTVAGGGVVLWAGGVLASLLTGRGVPHAAAVSGLRTLAHPGHPALGWRTPMPGPLPYWTVTTVLALAVVVPVVWLGMWWRRGDRRRRDDVRTVDGLADRADVKTAVSIRVFPRSVSGRGPVARVEVVGMVRLLSLRGWSAFARWCRRR